MNATTEAYRVSERMIPSCCRNTVNPPAPCMAFLTFLQGLYCSNHKYSLAAHRGGPRLRVAQVVRAQAAPDRPGPWILQASACSAYRVPEGLRGEGRRLLLCGDRSLDKKRCPCETQDPPCIVLVPRPTWMSVVRSMQRDGVVR